MSPLSLLLLLCAVFTVNTFKLLAATPTDIIEEEAIQPWEDDDGQGQIFTFNASANNL